MRTGSRAGIFALLALGFGTTAIAEWRCDCTRITGSCQATATVGDGFVEVTSNSAECSRVDYLVDGMPLVALVVDGTERQDWIADSESPSVIIQSCQVCLDNSGESSPAGAGQGLGADGEVTRLIEVSPDYPPAALEDAIEGFVEVQFVVTPEGQVANAQVVGAEPAGIFDGAALDAVRQWRYTRPAEPQTLTERIDFTVADGVLALRPTAAPAPTAAADTRRRNRCLQENGRYDFGATVDISLVNACDEPLIVYACAAGSGALADRWVCRDTEENGEVVAPSQSRAGQTVTAGSGTLAATTRFEISRAPNTEYWLLACAVDDQSCRSDGREWVRSLDRQTITLDPQDRTRARLARAY